jgi:hypothetical protein
MLPVVETDTEDGRWFQGDKEFPHGNPRPRFSETVEQVSFEQLGLAITEIMAILFPPVIIQKPHDPHFQSPLGVGLTAGLPGHLRSCSGVPGIVTEQLRTRNRGPYPDPSSAQRYVLFVDARLLAIIMVS